jgi:hypothetical protein
MSPANQKSGGSVQSVRSPYSSTTALQPTGGAELADLLAGFFVLAFTCLAFTCLAALFLQWQIAEFEWERAARAAFSARMPAPIYIPPLFDFAGHERLINEAALGIVALIIELLLIWQVRSRAWRVQAWLSPVQSSTISYIAGELQAIHQAAGRLVDSRPDGPPSEVRGATHPGVDLQHRDFAFTERSVEYRGFDNLGSEDLRIRAEMCFRLASGAVSRRLADELEALGQDFLREAEEVDNQDHVI